ncbi:MAG TPA: hypothetical protein VK204_01830 [Nocardioidaceae bacterium]|nr:hypothetical protein [Nocardioidaceae bacterium]
MSGDLTKPFREAVAEAERLIEGADFIRTEQDLAEGYDYLAGSVRASLQAAFEYDLEHPLFINSTHQYSKQGLDNPDAIYFHAYIKDDAEYVVTGRRGTTADLSFQVMNGSYSPAEAPDSVAAFDDRALEVAEDGTFEVRFGPARDDVPPNYFVLAPDSSILIVREVYSDWNTEELGRLRIHRVDTLGTVPPPVDLERVAKRYAVAAKMLVGRIHTWFAFPDWFTYKEPVNTLTAPQVTPGGLSSQFSSIGHYDLTEDEALVVTVPKADCAYQGIQIGSAWYISTDYVNHQTSLTAAQSHVDPDGLMRYVVSELNPGIANWLETTGHSRGVMMLRWQRLSRELTAEDGPRVDVVKVDELADVLPYYESQRVTPAEYAKRIEARQVGVARRMIS